MSFSYLEVGEYLDRRGVKWYHNEEFHNVYSSSNIIRMMKSRRVRWAGHLTYTGKKRTTYRILVRKPERKRPLGRHRLRQDDKNKKDLK
jgi:hypothetical protein